MTKKKKRARKGHPETIEVQPGYVVIDTSTASGGVHYQRRKSTPKAINRGKGVQQEIRTTKTVDHEAAVKAIDALVKRAEYACRTICAKTAFGWFVDDIGLRLLYKEFEGLCDEAAILNRAAARVGSERRAHVSLVAAKLELSTPHAAKEIARTVRKILNDVFVALRSGQVKRRTDDDGEIIMRDDLHAPLLRARNIDKLVIGTPGTAIRIALESIPIAKKEILERIRQGEDPSTAGAAVNLGAIENAIVWFEEDTDEAYSDPIAEALGL